jgi:hypothetical protein
MTACKGKQLARKILTRKGRIRTVPGPGTEMPREYPKRGDAPRTTPLGEDLRWEIISAYGHVLEKCSSPVEKEEDLPYSKELIRSAIYEELRENPDSEFRGHLEIAFAQLESFLSRDEYGVIEDFKQAVRIAMELAKSGDPMDIISSARILKHGKGEKALRIQEEISEKYIEG